MVNGQAPTPPTPWSLVGCRSKDYHRRAIIRTEGSEGLTHSFAASLPAACASRSTSMNASRQKIQTIQTDTKGKAQCAKLLQLIMYNFLVSHLEAQCPHLHEAPSIHPQGNPKSCGMWYEAMLSQQVGLCFTPTLGGSAAAFRPLFAGFELYRSCCSTKHQQQRVQMERPLVSEKLSGSVHLG